MDYSLDYWLFNNDSLKEDDTYVIKYGEASREDWFEDGEEYFYYYDATSSYTACFVLRPVHKDDSYVQNVGHILFKTETYEDLKDTSTLSGEVKELAQSLLDTGKTISAQNMAAALIDLMIAEGKLIIKTTEEGYAYYYIEKDAFEEYGQLYTEDSNIFYEEVQRGDMVPELDAWIYDDTRIQNEVSPTVVKASYGYHIMFYDGHGEEMNWLADVKNDITSGAYEQWYTSVQNETEIDDSQYAKNLYLIP